MKFRLKNFCVIISTTKLLLEPWALIRARQIIFNIDFSGAFINILKVLGLNLISFASIPELFS
jgi:hypothetical protein